MFTGIIGATAVVQSVRSRDQSTEIVVEVPLFLEGAAIGESIAVDGACLTVTEISDRIVRFDAVPETLRRTSLGELQVGSRVNLERAMRSDTRLDGHIVQGHVDETGVVNHLVRAEEGVRLLVDCSRQFASLLIEKGSVAIAGVSLTVVGVSEAGFDVALIPHTMAVTTLGTFGSGTRINLEADVLGKYVKRYLERIGVAGLKNK